MKCTEDAENIIRINTQQTERNAYHENEDDTETQ